MQRQRKHKMVKVDFGNPWYRNYLRGYVAAHQQMLNEVRKALPGWVVQTKKREAERVKAEPPRTTARRLAVVFDIDEVVLSNIHMNSYQDEHTDFHAADYFKWPRGARLNPLLPGAGELLAEVNRLGLDVFFITGRLESIREETIENFAEVGLAGEGRLYDSEALRRCAEDSSAQLHMCPDDEYPEPGESLRPFKEGRRRKISQTHRIVLNIGDQASDLGEYGDVQYLTSHPFYFTQ